MTTQYERKMEELGNDIKKGLDGKILSYIFLFNEPGAKPGRLDRKSPLSMFVDRRLLEGHQEVFVYEVKASYRFAAQFKRKPRDEELIDLLIKGHQPPIKSEELTLLFNKLRRTKIETN